MIQAKPVIPDQYWILRDQDRKVGNIQVDGHGYVVNIGAEQRRFSDLQTLSHAVNIVFESGSPSNSDAPDMEVHGYPTRSRAYNSVFDVRHQLPLWTTEPRSRSWLAAGWYRIRQHRTWKAVYCPKLIILERYQYQGPFRSLQEAQTA